MAAKTVIRPAAEADIPAILALYRQLDSALVAMQPEFFCESPREEDEIRKAIRADDAGSFLLATRRRSCRLCAGRLRGLDAGVQRVLPHRYARLEELWPWTRPCEGRASAASFWPPPSAGHATGAWST